MQHQPNTNSVGVEHDERSFRGWRVDQILAILFDTPSLYDLDTEDLLREHARLKVLSDMGQLPSEKRHRFAELEMWVEQNQAPPGNSQREMEDYRDLQRRIHALSEIFSG